MVRDPAAGRRLRDFVETRMRDGTKQELIERAGLHKQQLYRWFAGEEPSMGGLRNLADALGVRRCELVCAFDGDEA